MNDHIKVILPDSITTEQLLSWTKNVPFIEQEFVNGKSQRFFIYWIEEATHIDQIEAMASRFECDWELCTSSGTITFTPQPAPEGITVSNAQRLQAWYDRKRRYRMGLPNQMEIYA